MSKADASRKIKTKYTIGIDLGGTKVAAALVSADGRILNEVKLPTVPEWMGDVGPKHREKSLTPVQVRHHIAYVIEAMADAAFATIAPIRKGKRFPGLRGVGLASAGPMNIDKGTLEHPANFMGWKIVPIVKLLKEALAKRGLHSPVSFQNDAMAAALAEGWVGKARDCDTYAMITVGTGIGTGVVFNGRPAQSQGMGSEWGHMLTLTPGLSKDRGAHYDRSVEGIASGTGVIRRARARGFKGEHSGELAAAARSGDPLARDIFREASEALAGLLYSLSLGFHPEKFLMSGGMLALRDVFLPQTIELYTDLMKRKNAAFLAPVQIAKLGNNAGVIGAARLPYLESA